MDMQNVSNLQIPEGMVKTIHDKDSRLLWGAVGYDTKYAGDTSQQTYSGKNLYPGSQDFSGEWYKQNEWTTETEKYNGLTVKSRSAAWGGMYKQINVEAGKTYTFSVYAKAESNRTADLYILDISGATATVSPKTLFNITLTTSWQRFKITFTVSASGVVCPRIENNNTGTKTYICGYQLEESASMTDYEPYVGGTASPNPDYPQDIQVVTGEQTVTASDGTNSEDFTVNLGSTELCKISTYQDYIYKTGSDWYVHKETNKIVLDGSQTISLSNWRASSTSVGWVYAYNVFNSATIVASSVGAIVSDKLLAASFTSLFDKTQDNGIALYTNTDYGLAVRTTDLTLTTASAINTYLTSNSITVYYPLATPTDTKITDSTLISQLNAVHQWLVRYGYNATVTGNLPIVIDRTNL